MYYAFLEMLSLSKLIQLRLLITLFIEEQKECALNQFEIQKNKNTNLIINVMKN